MSGDLICNAGPIIALSVIKKIDLLRRLYGMIIVPLPVHEEILAGALIFPAWRSIAGQAG